MWRVRNLGIDSTRSIDDSLRCSSSGRNSHGSRKRTPASGILMSRRGFPPDFATCVGLCEAGSGATILVLNTSLFSSSSRCEVCSNLRQQLQWSALRDWPPRSQDRRLAEETMVVPPSVARQLAAGSRVDSRAHDARITAVRQQRRKSKVGMLIRAHEPEPGEREEEEGRRVRRQLQACSNVHVDMQGRRRAD